MIGEVRKAACIAIGDELLRGDYPDSNSGYIAQRLAELGIRVERFAVVGDDPALLERCFYELAREYQIVVATGGLGPTLDDVTRDAAAKAAGVGLERDAATESWLRESFAQRGRSMPESNLRQADFPVGAQIMPNSCGTARGFRLWIDGGMLAALPGPPREMREMLERELLPWLRATCGVEAAIRQHNFYLIGLAESAFADRAGEWMARGAQPLMGVTAHTGILKVTLRAESHSADRAQALIAERAAAFRERFAPHIYSEDESRPAFAVGRLFRERGRTLALAESCTGGLVSELLTEMPGISAVLRAAWVSYSNDAKVELLGVPRELIERHGAVSEEVAAAMARGARERARADVALAVTGIAGPDGGSADKPVGLVCFALDVGGRSETHTLRYPQVDRTSIRRFAAHTALDLLRRSLDQRSPASS